MYGYPVLWYSEFDIESEDEPRSEFAIREEDLNLRLDFRVSIRVMLRMGT